jgi:hypothetical protein
MPETPPRAVIFWEEGFPFLDTRPLTQHLLSNALHNHFTIQFCTASQLPEALSSSPDLFILPYGSAFPKSMWGAFVAYLRGGGNWVNLGGAPLMVPVRRRDGVQRRGDLWQQECPQTQYGKELRINHAYPIDLPENAALRCPPLDIDLETHFHRFHPSRAWSLQVRFTTAKDFPDEIGSSGAREAALHPLALAELNGRTLAAPIIAIDRLLGEFAGGRWILAACQGAHPLPGDLIARLCEYAVRPRAHLQLRPTYACYYPGEMACLNVNVNASFAGELKLNLRVFSKENQREIYAHIYRLRCGAGPAMVQTSPFPAPDPGLYDVRATVEDGLHSKPIGSAENAFWVYDRDLISSGEPLTLDRDYFYLDGKPYPITGTTYMSGDSHRKFLFEPNPAVWDADFAAMKAAGVNMVRTGIWTGWRRVMLDPGSVDESVLRALTAYLLTARRYDIPVIFTLFSFLPETWGGNNPYLDPQSVAAQTAFVAAFARRFAAVPSLIWDLINEPSFCSPAHIWRVRPHYDQYERAAWAQWLQAQGLSEDEWRERWRLTPEMPLDLPALEDFQDGFTLQGKRPLRCMDYRRFAQERFRDWAAHLAQVIRENGNPAQLVTVGQDEGGTEERPAPHFYGTVVDFTCNHSWWNHDDLLWDSLITKTPDKPNLIEETGIMFGERVDGAPLRTPDEARNLLERKLALAFAGGGAGFIQWLWNTNVCLDSDIEAGIGLLRADGSEKPEMESFRRICRFFAENAHRMIGREREQACIVIPYSSLFSMHGQANAATRRAVRSLEYSLGIPCRVVSEYRVQEMGAPALVVLPSARVLTEACWQSLLEKTAEGAVLLVTGFIESDEYWRPIPRLKRFGIETLAAGVHREESAFLAGSEPIRATFAKNQSEKIERAVSKDGSRMDALLISHGRGVLLYCPLPVELSESESQTVYPLYQRAAQIAGLHPPERPRQLSGLLVRREVFADCLLYLIVNETGSDIPPQAQTCGLAVPAGRIAMAFVDRRSGERLSSLSLT